MQETIIETKSLGKHFINADRQELRVLDKVNFSMQEGEIIALLGKSGSGKSTFLRLIAGLIKPSEGEIFYRQKLAMGPVKNVAMVFQSFALMPWLSVLENVELGLEAQGVPQRERRKRALKAIDMIGLDGFESAYPKELSGGMRQRVGFARALVVEPEILIMDEPFSALDILTAENLRNDLLDLWHSKKTKIKAILCVTHDIEEAIILANRILIFANDPGRIQSELTVKLPYPRDTDSKGFQKLINEIYVSMTTSERDRIAKAKAISRKEIEAIDKYPEYAYRIPEVEISELTGFLEAVGSSYANTEYIDLPELSETLHLDVDDIFPLTEVLDLLRFVKISDGKLSVTKSGAEFAQADILQRKQIFAQHLLKYIPLANHIRLILDQNPGHRAAEDFFLDELGNFFSEEESERILRTIIAWGRYAELFAYDYDSGELSLENPQ